ncbi:nicotinate phosphoribosyltransferase [Sinorhizobium phage phiM7]|uniref:Nicotinamide phosphoribosyltransferase n=1 Tax=Sinorhizobium phage phiM7 TaxID=1647403 RepID=A0A0F6YP59_9CAUD|nr:nicotinamide phosphoribosyl transferase [Sinorhizobium phage phiM7]AKF12756.1 nicotinate phosphoribosyltransferase [Sinorhizobium phage phiM7]
MLNNRNIIAATDCYKFSHPFVVRRDATSATSYIEARGGWTNEVVFFGIQAFIREYLNRRLTMKVIDREERKAKSAMVPFNRVMWERVVMEFDGFVPVKVQALPEGTVVRPGTVVVQISSDIMPEIVADIETSLLRAIWYPSTVATLSRAIKKNIRNYYIATSDLDVNNPMTLACALNDFGARGTSSGESAALGGLAHAINFLGSDTFEAIDAAIDYYDHDLDRDGPVIISVPATEHSVTTMNGEDGECDFAGRVIDTFTEMGFPIISIVADSFDLDRFVSDYIGTALKEKIETRDGWIVVRPDSGVPEEIVPHVLRLLDDKFGSTVNSKGFKVLNPKVRVIQGDGVNRDSIDRILEAMMVAGFSAENVVFGMGGQLLQAPMRDDFSWAMKTNEIVVDGEKIDVQKRPKTDMSKASKAGRQAVVFNGKELVSIRESDLIKANARGGHGVRNWLELVWDTGKVYRTQTFAEVRANAKL